MDAAPVWSGGPSGLGFLTGGFSFGLEVDRFQSGRQSGQPAGQLGLVHLGVGGGQVSVDGGGHPGEGQRSAGLSQPQVLVG